MLIHKCYTNNLTDVGSDCFCILEVFITDVLWCNQATLLFQPRNIKKGKGGQHEHKSECSGIKYSAIKGNGKTRQQARRCFNSLLI